MCFTDNFYFKKLGYVFLIMFLNIDVLYAPSENYYTSQKHYLKIIKLKKTVWFILQVTNKQIMLLNLKVMFKNLNFIGVSSLPTIQQSINVFHESARWQCTPKQNL